MTDDELRSIEPGTGVFWHEPTPPYRLCFGVVIAYLPPDELSISVPGRGRIVHARADRIHRDLMEDTQTCPFCRVAAIAEG